MGNKFWIVITLLCPLTLAAGIVHSPRTAEMGKAKREKELRQISIEFKEAVLKNDVQTILKYISKKHGVTCVDDLIPYKEVEQDLHDPNSYLYLYLFEPQRYNEEFGKEDVIRPMAVKEFFQRATDLRIEVGFMEPERFGFKWAGIHYGSSISQFGVNVYLYRRDDGEKWTISSGLYDCGGGL